MHKTTHTTQRPIMEAHISEQLRENDENYTLSFIAPGGRIVSEYSGTLDEWRAFVSRLERRIDRIDVLLKRRADMDARGTE